MGIFVPPETYYSESVSRTTLPEDWLEKIDEQEEHMKEEEEELKKHLDQLRHPDGRKYTKAELKKMERYAHV